MSIEIVTRHMCISTDLKRGVTELCEAVMRCFPDVLRVRVVLDDINGPNKAGIDKRCHLLVRGRDHLRIDINEFQDDVWQSVDSAFRQLSIKLARYRRQDSEAKLPVSGDRMHVYDYRFTDQAISAGTQAAYRPYKVEGKVNE